MFGLDDKIHYILKLSTYINKSCFKDHNNMLRQLMIFLFLHDSGVYD